MTWSPSKSRSILIISALPRSVMSIMSETSSSSRVEARSSNRVVSAMQELFSDAYALHLDTATSCASQAVREYIKSVYQSVAQLSLVSLSLVSFAGNEYIPIASSFKLSQSFPIYQRVDLSEQRSCREGLLKRICIKRTHSYREPAVRMSTN